jgi:hypothetical protein
MYSTEGFIPYIPVALRAKTTFASDAQTNSTMMRTSKTSTKGRFEFDRHGQSIL